MARMRIAILADIPWPTGAAGSIRVRRWAQELSGAGHEVLVLPIGHYGASAPQATADAFALAPEARFPSNYGALGRGGVRGVRAIGAAMRQFRPEWVLGYGRRLSSLGACVGQMPRGARLALDVVEHPCITLWERGWHSAVGWDHWTGARLLARRADALFAITPALAQACSAWSRAPIVVVPGMVPGAQAPVPKRSRTLGYYGGWHAKDDPAYLLAMIERVLAPAPAAPAGDVVRFETVGRVPAEFAERLARIAADPGRILHHGMVADGAIAPAIGAWSAAIMPRADVRSARFAFPNRAAELLACGTPVLVRESMGIAGLGLAEGVVEMPSNDPGAAALAAQALLADGARLEALQAAARWTAETTLSARRAVGTALEAMRRASGHAAP